MDLVAPEKQVLQVPEASRAHQALRGRMALMGPLENQVQWVQLEVPDYQDSMGPRALLVIREKKATQDYLALLVPKE